LIRHGGFNVRILCVVAEVSRSGFYLCQKEKDKRVKKDENDYLLIKSVFNPKTGARSIKMKLEDKGIVINLKKIQRIMRKYSLICAIRRVNKSRVSLQKNKENMFVRNMLNRGFKQYIPYKFASTDITYLRHQNSFSFLSVVKDLASGEVLTYKLSKEMSLGLVLNTIDSLEKYFKRNNLDLSKLLLHSDQGFQYTNLTYHNKLKKLQITQSMSRKGNSVDNAPIESFFGHMKDELSYRDLNFYQLSILIDDYMIKYNYKRKQWGRQKMSPVLFRDYLLDFANKSV